LSSRIIGIKVWKGAAVANTGAWAAHDPSVSRDKTETGLIKRLRTRLRHAQLGIPYI